MNTTRSIQFLAYLGLAGAFAVAAACSDAPAPRKKAGPSVPGPKSPKTSLLGSDQEAPEVAYAYSPIGKRDPFRSFFEEFQNEANNTDLTELQRFEVDQLNLVAIVTGRATPYAMVQDPGSKGHTLTRGTLIGKNWGRVAQITVDCVVIKEEYRDYTGRKVTNTIDMCLPKPEELKLD